MDADQWTHVKDIFAAALEREPGERDAFVRGACDGDESLRIEVVSLLAAYDTGDGLSTAPWPAAAAVTTIEGRLLGPYLLIRKLGEGGMGQVWLAEQTAPVRRHVALKLIRIGVYDKAVLRRFQAERQSLAIMDHPAIAKVFDAGATRDGQPYFVMEYVQGLPITDYCSARNLNTRERLELFLAACEGVQHAHQKAIIHRDLKPANILVVAVDGKPTPRIIDFGLAKAATPEPSDPGLTRIGTLVGTPGYMSPEQADPASRDVDTRTDVYSLGAVLYELLTGALPFDVKECGSVDEVLRRIRDEDPPRPSTKVGALRGDLDSIAMKALERDRDRRYGSPSGLADDIKRYLHNQPVLARPASTAYRLWKYGCRHQLAVSAGLALILLLAAAAIVEGVQLRRITRERDRANRITDFMTTMFRVADPSEQRGNSVTAREILDNAAKGIETGLAQDPLLQAQMMEVIGGVYSSLGVYSGAQPLLERAVDVWTRTLGPDHPTTLASSHSLADTLGRRGRYPEAEKLEARTFEASRRVLGLGNAATVRSMSSLAITLTNEGRLQDAERLTREAVDVARRALGDDHPDTLRPLNSLGDVVQRLGRYAEAEQYHSEALARRRRVLGPEHPQTLISLQGLAGDLREQLRFVEAEQMDRELVEMRRRLYGDAHPYTVSARLQLARDLTRQGRHADAERLNRETLEISRRSLGEEATDTVSLMVNLADNIHEQGRFTESEPLNRKALEIHRRMLGPDHEFTLVSMMNLAIDLVSLGRLPEAEPLAREAVERSRRTLGGDHPYTLSAISALVDCLTALRRYPEAESLARELVAGSRRAFTAPDSRTGDAEYSLATVLAREGKRDEAVAALHDATAQGVSNETLTKLAADPALMSLARDAGFKTGVIDATLRGDGPERVSR
jgi:non-specific serine/threonine protein kinase/serine/threonine-protein kinase